MPDISVLGIIVADILARPVARYPDKGRLDLVDVITQHIGGCAANSSVGLARLGLDVAVMGKVGSDALGDFCIDFLEKQCVNTSGVTKDPSAGTSATMVMIHPDSERSFIHCIGANGTLRPEDVNMDLLRDSKTLFVAGSLLMPGFDGEPTAEVLRKAKEFGVTTALDTVWNASSGWMRAMKPVLPYVDYFLPSEGEARAIAEREDLHDVAGALMDAGAGTVVITCGPDGAYARSASEEFSVPALEVESVDGTGAGDAFAAGFLCGLQHGWDLRKCAQLGTAVGALCVMAVGTTTGYRSLADTLNFMEQYQVGI